MEAEKIKYANFKRILIIMIPITIIGVFIYSYNEQEQLIDKKLDICSFYTIASPLKMFGSHKLRFNFFYKGKYYERNQIVGANDLGYSYTQASTLKRRYWIRIHCTDFDTFRFYWKVKVPEDLQKIPAEGWQEIPQAVR